ncbi:MAG: DUF433 domain-containing protein [Actinomycetota bacterium]|nr:DUF433 domain-containing protein [Actinomycetota bacterium]
MGSPSLKAGVPTIRGTRGTVSAVLGQLAAGSLPQECPFVA